MRDEIQRRIVREHLPALGDKPQGGIGTVGWIDETSVAKRVDNAGMYGKPFKGKAWKRIKLERKTSGPQTWNVRAAQVENLWASLKNELVSQRTFGTKQEAMDAIFEWIVIWYNRKRRHSSLGYVSPEAFEAKQN